MARAMTQALPGRGRSFVVSRPHNGKARTGHETCSGAPGKASAGRERAFTRSQSFRPTTPTPAVTSSLLLAEKTPFVPSARSLVMSVSAISAPSASYPSLSSPVTSAPPAKPRDSDGDNDGSGGGSSISSSATSPTATATTTGGVNIVA